MHEQNTDDTYWSRNKLKVKVRMEPRLSSGWARTRKQTTKRIRKWATTVPPLSRICRIFHRRGCQSMINTLPVSQSCFQIQYRQLTEEIRMRFNTILICYGYRPDALEPGTNCAIFKQALFIIQFRRWPGWTNESESPWKRTRERFVEMKCVVLMCFGITISLHRISEKLLFSVQ